MTVFMYFDFAVDVNIFHTVFCEKKSNGGRDICH